MPISPVSDEDWVVRATNTIVKELSADPIMC